MAPNPTRLRLSVRGRHQREPMTLKNPATLSSMSWHPNDAQAWHDILHNGPWVMRAATITVVMIFHLVKPYGYSRTPVGCPRRSANHRYPPHQLLPTKPWAATNPHPTRPNKPPPPATTPRSPRPSRRSSAVRTLFECTSLAAVHRYCWFPGKLDKIKLIFPA
jgi:hypothetical protein